MITRFINSITLKEESTIDKNVSDKVINVYIKKAQEADLQDLLGRNLYIHLQNQVKNNTLTTKERELLSDYIVEYLITIVEQYLIEDQMLSIRNGGIIKGQPDNAVNASIEEIRIIRNSKEKLVRRYASFITSYINNNLDDFSTFNSNDNMVEPSKPRSIKMFFMSDYLDEIQNLQRSANNKNEEGI